MSATALRFIRPFVKVSSTIAPRLTGNLMFKIFCLPPRVKNLDAEQKKRVNSAQDRLAEAQTEQVAFEHGLVQTYRFKTTLTPAKGTILLLHGWTGRAAFMSAFIAPILEQGYDVLAVDLPGHGESSGRSLNIPLGMKALHAVHARFGAWFAIVAHSFGGAIANALVSGGMKSLPAISVERLVLIGTPHSMPEIFTWFGNAMGLTRKGQQGLNDNVPRLTGNPLSTFEGKDQLAKAGIPTLILHAPDDKEASFAGAEIMASAGPHVRLKAMDGLGHRRILYARATVEAAVSFIDGTDGETDR